MTKASWMSSALAAAFALSFPEGGFAATETVNGIKWTYTIYDGRATLGGTDCSPLALARTTAGAVSIPSRLGGRPVTEIGERAFYNCAQITAVTIPDTVDEIGEEAFSGCAALASVSLPTSLREIDDRAFALCRSLKGTLEIPEGVRDVGFGAFMGTGLARFASSRRSQAAAISFLRNSQSHAAYRGRIAAARPLKRRESAFAALTA